MGVLSEVGRSWQAAKEALSEREHDETIRPDGEAQRCGVGRGAMTRPQGAALLIGTEATVVGWVGWLEASRLFHEVS